LYQARQVAAAGIEGEFDAAEAAALDERIAPALGGLVGARFRRALRAAVMTVNPAKARRRQSHDPEGRFVRRYATDDPRAAFIKARLDTADAVFFEATIDWIARHLFDQDPRLDLDACRAKAMGLLANPAAVVERFGLMTGRDMTHPPATADEMAGFRRLAGQIARLARPEVRLFVHVHWGNLDEDDALAHVDDLGPCFMDQVRDLVGHGFVKVTPVVHLGYGEMAVDSYEIPDRIREHVFLRDRYEAFPYSSKAARACDLDHITPYQPGAKAQTRPSNLAPLSRRVHRVKTHAGWTYHQPHPGVYHWTSPGGQHFQVNHLGTTPIPADVGPPD
jgi:hypothetical protein